MKTNPEPGLYALSWSRLVSLCAFIVLVLGSAGVRANDFPTQDRVLYVQECMQAHPGPGFEMTSKCACALDAMAQQLSYDDFVTLQTISKATTIAGERGGAIRDAPSLTSQLKRYRAIQAQAEKGCFLAAASR